MVAIRFRTVLFVGIASLISLCQEPEPTSPGGSARDSTQASSAYVPVHKFDPKRDGSADIQAAIGEAQRTGKRIILDVGGDWCQWCQVLDRFWEKNRGIVALREKNFVMVAIFYSHENKNEKVLGRYPKVEGIPHFYVLEKDGTFLYSQGMLKLETGGEPDPTKMRAFLNQWSAPAVADPAKN